MADDEKPVIKKFKLHRLIGYVCLFVFLAMLVYIATSLLSGRGIGLVDLFSPRGAADSLREYQFDVGRGRVFADLGDGVASVGTLGIQVFNSAGGETLREPFRMTTPAVYSQDGRAIAFDIGGTAVRVFNRSEIITAIETQGAIIAASINKNGWFCVCTQEGGGYKGLVTVYNNRGDSVYRAFLESGYVLTAALSPDNRYLAVLNLPNEGSRITFYRLNSLTPDSVFDLPGGLMIDMRFSSNSELIVVSTQALLEVDRNGDGRGLYEFSGRTLGGYSIGSGFTALHLLDYGVGHRGSIVTLDGAGAILGEHATDREIISISAGGEYLAALRSDGLVFFNSVLEEFPAAGRPGATAGATQVLTLENGAAIAAGDNSAVIFRVGTSG